MSLANPLIRKGNQGMISIANRIIVTLSPPLPPPLYIYINNLDTDLPISGLDFTPSKLPNRYNRYNLDMDFVTLRYKRYKRFNSYIVTRW